MAVGDKAVLGGFSYLAIGRETTAGTYNTCTAGLDFLSSSIKIQKDSKILEQVEAKRSYSKRLSLSKTVGGALSFYLVPDATAQAWIFQNAFGGTVTSATATGETAGGAAQSHTFALGNMDQSAQALCINHRKGDSTNGKIFEYSGVRVNSLELVAQIDDPVMVNLDLIAFDASQTSNNLESSVITATALDCLSFVDARFSVEGTFASLTSSSFWHVQSVNFKMNNNLKNGNEARRIGSDTLAVLPPGMQTYELSVTMRFDTTTAYDAMIAGTTEYGVELEFLGPTLGTSIIRKGLSVLMQKAMVKDAGDPEISGPDGILTANVTFDVLRDESASGYAVQAILTNAMATATFAL